MNFIMFINCPKKCCPLGPGALSDSNKWSVAFNESKCAIVHFHTKSDSVNFQYYLKNQAISKATMYRDLGVFVYIRYALLDTPL